VPYEKVTDLPESVREHLPEHAQEIYKSAFNSAEKQYGDESTAHKVAWSAVENKYKKDEDSGDWVRKDS
jgi:cation transport regulator